METQPVIPSSQQGGVSLIDSNGEEIQVEQRVGVPDPDVAARELERAKAEAFAKKVDSSGRMRKATATAKPKTRQTKPKTSPDSGIVDVDDIVAAKVKEQLQAMGLVPEDDPEPTEIPVETGEFNRRLYLAGRGDITRQIVLMHPNNPRYAYRFRDGVLQLRGNEGEEVYYDLLTRYPDEVFEDTWDYSVGAAPACAECGYRVPNYRAFNAHQNLHMQENVRSF